MRRMLGLLAALMLFSAAAAAAQEPPPAAGAPASALFVFLDCQDVGCDFDFFRTEITAVNWVRDRQVADVHILVTGQTTGSGGRDFTATFIGLRQFTALADTLHYVQPPSSTSDEQRRGMARMFRMGLVRFIARTPAGDKVVVSFGDQSQTSRQVSPKTDPWNAWVFQLSMSGFTFGEETYKYFNVNGNFRATRITDTWKTQFRVNTNYSQDEFEIDDTTKAVNIRRNYFASLLQVRSLGAHWSAGLRTDASSSTYDNTSRHVRAAPAIEFNVFPYAQSTRRQFKFEYAIGLTDQSYRDTTIYDKLAETLPLHRFFTSLTQRQPWGQVDVGVTATQYLHDQTKYRISSEAELSVRLFKGFNVNFGGRYDVIHDQLSLLKKNYTPQEILLRQFQRGTTYSYQASVGVNYTFGSLFNNVVNPRFN
ncbi:MAG: hypothetical protein AABZ80_03220 [Gemmatimonadota bacterium]